MPAGNGADLDQHSWAVNSLSKIPVCRIGLKNLAYQLLGALRRAYRLNDDSYMQYAAHTAAIAKTPLFQDQAIHFGLVRRAKLNIGMSVFSHLILFKGGVDCQKLGRYCTSHVLSPTLALVVSIFKRRSIFTLHNA